MSVKDVIATLLPVSVEIDAVSRFRFEYRPRKYSLPDLRYEEDMNLINFIFYNTRTSADPCLRMPLGQLAYALWRVAARAPLLHGSERAQTQGLPQRFVMLVLCLSKMPIRISKGALGLLGPSRDTYFSPSHAIHCYGSLVGASALMNFTSIQQICDWKASEITYYNIELASHGLITANGLLVESDYANYRGNSFSRVCWDNDPDYRALYGESNGMEELPMPRIPFARQLPAELRLMLQLDESNQLPALTL